MSSLHSVSHGPVTLAAESFGDPAAPAVLMIMGATVSSRWWPDALCAALAAGGRFVVRYDNRDTGQSTAGAPGALDYTVDDMAADAVAVLDHFRRERAHLVGMSLGGMIAQIVALTDPHRVASLTAIGSGRLDEDDPDLPPLDPALLAHFGGLATLDWSDRAAVVAFQVETQRICAGGDPGFDAEAARHLAEREYDHARTPASAFNHAMLGGGERFAGRLGEIAAPLLVLHGRRDPISSLAHGRRLAEAVPGARLTVLEEAGHTLTPRDWPRIVDAILAHTAGAEAAAG